MSVKSLKQNECSQHEVIHTFKGNESLDLRSDPKLDRVLIEIYNGWGVKVAEITVPKIPLFNAIQYLCRGV